MNKKYRNKYRISSIRLRGHDYRTPGMYFVTICTKNRVQYFGDKSIGQIAHDCWLAIPEHFSFVALDEFVIMPDHVHGIVSIGDGNANTVETPKLGVWQNNVDKKNNRWSPGCLGVIINQYKRICTIKIRRHFPNFQWQSRYYEHVVRETRALVNIRRYIKNHK